MHQQGMTLIEVLIALAIIAIALMAVIQTTGMSTKQLARAQDVALAHWVARNAGLRLQLGIESQTMGAGVWQGVDTIMGRNFYWSADAKNLAQSYAMEITVTVAARQGGAVLNTFTTYAPMPGL
jgi:general secretion pathway protein I